jgi:hypothetical protein
MVSNPRKEALGETIPEQDLWPLDQAVRLRIEQIGSWERGVVSIEDALMTPGKLRSARWDNASGKPEPELLSPEFWQAHLIVYEVPKPIANIPIANIPIANIYPRTGVREWGPWAYNPLHRVGGEYYVSRSDYEKIWPAKKEPELPQVGKPAEEETEETVVPQNRKPGRKPKKGWPLHVAGELYRIVVMENKPVPPASYFAQFCEDKLDYQPDIRAVQKLIKQLLGD